MNVRKKIESRENNRVTFRNSIEYEMEQKKDQIRIAREREKISKLTLKVAMEQKNKDVLFMIKEQEEEQRTRR